MLWIGVPFASLLFGDVFRLLSPWRAIGRAVGWVAARVAIRRRAARAAALPRAPRALAGGRGHPLLRRLRALLGGRARAADARDPRARLPRDGARGDEPLRRRAVDAQRGPVRRLLLAVRPARAAHPPRRRALRPPAGHRRGRPRSRAGHRGAAARRRSASPRSTAPARARRSTPWHRTSRTSSGASERARGRRSSSRSCLGLAVTVLAVSAIYWGAIHGMGLRGLRQPTTRVELGRALLHTLVPIAAAYVVAHYFSLLAYNGQDLWRLASDPLGRRQRPLRRRGLRGSTTPSSPRRRSGTSRSPRW